MRGSILIYSSTDETVMLGIKRGSRTTRIWMSVDEAQHISNRLQSFAKGNSGTEEHHIEEEQP
jgi:hypothetical protein